MLNGKNGTAIYMIDENYRLLDFEKGLETYFPNIQKGSPCYTSLYNINQPCSNCPLTSVDKHCMKFCQELGGWLDFYSMEMSEKSQTRKVIHLSEIDTISEGFSLDIFYSASFEELFLVDYLNDTARRLSETGTNLVPPNTNGILSENINKVAQRLVHPDDREAFLDFWDKDSVMKRIKLNKMLWKKFRKLTKDGTYQRTDQVLVPYKIDENNFQVLAIITNLENGIKNEEEIQVLDYELNSLTGLLKRRSFMSHCRKLLDKHPEINWAMVAIDIENFKLFNEWYGLEAGDMMLKNIAKNIKAIENETCIAGYFADDDFFVLMPKVKEDIDNLYKSLSKYREDNNLMDGFLPSIGVFEIKDTSLSVSTICNNAQIAMDNSKHNYTNRISCFNDTMAKNISDNQKLLAQVKSGLDNNEFTFYIQPKCDVKSGKIIGGEALVRWFHPVRGIVPPFEYIPLLEEIGLITDLDKYVWEKVCQTLRKWLDMGVKCVPISVNVSIRDLESIDIPAHFKSLVEKYNLPPNLLSIEITESAFTENVEKIRDVIDRLIELGFLIYLDDFGSGYSSLNMLKDVNVNILKIDMKFMDLNEKNQNKGIKIVESIIKMAHMMNIFVITEGVEEKTHVDFLLSMGCDYAQGYYYYKPMPIESYEQLVFDENNIDLNGMQPKRINHLYAKDLIQDDLISDLEINNIIGPSAYYELDDENNITLIQSNEQYNEIMGIKDVNSKINLIDLIHPDDKSLVYEMLDEAYNNKVSGSHGILRKQTKANTYIWLSVLFYHLRTINGKIIFFSSIRDDTQKMLELLKKRTDIHKIKFAVEVENNNKSFKNLDTDNLSIAADVYENLFPVGMLGSYLETTDFSTIFFASDEIIRMLGYKDYQDIYLNTNGNALNLVHPDDRARIGERIPNARKDGHTFTLLYRSLRKDGSFFWNLHKGKVVSTPDGKLATISGIIDITEIVEEQNLLFNK